jgi:hypothetical protein
MFNLFKLVLANVSFGRIVKHSFPHDFAYVLSLVGEFHYAPAGDFRTEKMPFGFIAQAPVFGRA